MLSLSLTVFCANVQCPTDFSLHSVLISSDENVKQIAPIVYLPRLSYLPFLSIDTHYLLHPAFLCISVPVYLSILTR